MSEVMPKLKVVRGWTLLRKPSDWEQWHEARKALYAEPVPCFPCFVQERLTTDEESAYEYMTEGMMADLQAAIDSRGTA